MPDPNTEHGLQVQLATALRERDEAREEAAKYRKDAFHNAKQGVDCWEERDALRAEVMRLREALGEALEWILGEGSIVPERLVGRIKVALASGGDRE